MADEITITTATEHDWDAVYQTMSRAFNEDGSEDSSQAERHVFEPARFLLARRGDELVGTAAVVTRRMAVPGTTAPVGHVTMIGVAATARRQGVLTRFIRRQFDDIRAAGEPVAALWATEGKIYQRFGYGLAARRMSMKIDTREVRLTTPAAGARLRAANPEDVRKTIMDVYAQAYPTRPGWSERHDSNWNYRLADPAAHRDGASERQALLHLAEDDSVDGYVLWRTKADWDSGGPAGEVRVQEMVATTPRAYRDLWQFLLTVDLTRSTSMWLAAIDEPLPYLVNEPRRMGLTIGDCLWVRIIDLPAALRSRRYSAPVDVVLDVTDELIPDNTGRWRLGVGADGTATCSSTVDEADLSCDIRAVGAAYLGDQAFGPLAAAGLVRELRPGALAAAATAFGWHRAPSCPEIF